MYAMYVYEHCNKNKNKIVVYLYMFAKNDESRRRAGTVVQVRCVLQLKIQPG